MLVLVVRCLWQGRTIQASPLGPGCTQQLALHLGKRAGSRAGAAATGWRPGVRAKYYSILFGYPDD